MSSGLDAFLSRRSPFSEHETVWGTREHPTPLRARAYLGEELPPLDSVSSVRGVVLRGGDVLVMRNADELHILPGGRREAGETLARTLEREVLEEAGWAVEVGPVLGFIHFLHLGPRPPDYAHPYPEFAQVVFRTVARRHLPEAKLPDDYEVEAVFRPVAEVVASDILPAGGVFLEAALRGSGRGRV